MHTASAIDDMRRLVARRHQDALDQVYGRAPTSAETDTFAALAAVDLVPFENELRRMLELAADVLTDKVRAVYWQFDVDNGWSSAAFLCNAYRAEGENDDDWAADFDPANVIVGPAAPELFALRPKTWDATGSDAALTLYLVA